MGAVCLFTLPSSFDTQNREYILGVQVPSGAPPQGGEQRKPSKQVFGGFSHNRESVLVKEANFVYETLGINQAHLRHECGCLLILHQTDLDAEFVLLWRS